MLKYFVRTAVIAAACTSPLLADDMKMAGDAKMKQDISDPSKMGMMKDEMMKMMIMEQMARQMANDPDFQKMHMDMMKSDAGMQMKNDEMAMSKDAQQMMTTKQQVMNDPQMMHMVMMHAMMMDAMKNDSDMKMMMGNTKDDMMKQ